METQTALLKTLKGLKSQIEALEAQVAATQQPAGKSPATEVPTELPKLTKAERRERNRSQYRQVLGFRGEATKQAKAGDLKKARAAISKANRIATERGWTSEISRNNQHLKVLVG